MALGAGAGWREAGQVDELQRGRGSHKGPFTIEIPAQTPALYACDPQAIVRRVTGAVADASAYESAAGVALHAEAALDRVSEDTLRMYGAYVRKHKAPRPTIQHEMMRGTQGYRARRRAGARDK